MLNIIIQGILFFLVGIIIGIFGTLLFFRLDKGWKQIFLGLGGAFSVGGIGTLIISYLKVPQDKISLMILVMVIGLLGSVYITFKKLCKLLKEQSGQNVIRVLDIILGYDQFLAQYYNSRQKNLDAIVNTEKIEQKQKELEIREIHLNDLQKGIDEQIKEVLFLKLPENSEYVLTNHFVHKIPLYVDHICRFTRDLENLTDDFIQKLESEDPNLDKKGWLKAYFAGVGIYVANDLFGTSNEDVRTHFRVLKDGCYTQYTVALGAKLSEEKISDIPVGDSMIDKSFKLKKSLVASLNSESVYDTNSKWEDFMTITYYNLVLDGIPFLSMGISIKYAEQFKDMLYFLNFCRIEDCLYKNIKK